MKAIVVTDQATGTAGMKLVKRPKPQGAALASLSGANYGDVVVQVHASGFTEDELSWPPTWIDRLGRDRTPSIPGHEMAGVVTALSYGTTGLSMGQRVFGLTDWTRDGTLAEYVAVEARNLTPKTTVRTDTSAYDDGLSSFLSARTRLFGIAYRMLKSTAEAEEVVQDVWIRWQTTDRSTVEDPAAFLSTTTRRLAINVIQSARSRHETSGLPSPREPADPSGDPELETERREALQSAVLVLLERLSPAERSAYVLREAFDYSYGEIAKILRLEEANSRQLVSRARRHVADGRHADVNSEEQHRLLATFVAAAREGALTALESFLVGAAHSSVGKRSGPHGLDRRSSERLRYHAPANRWTVPAQRDVKVAESCGDGDPAPWSTLTRNPLPDDELLECIQIAVGE